MPKYNQKMTPEKLERACDLRRRSWSVQAIANDLGLSLGCIAWNLLKEGVDPPKPPKSWDAPQGPIVVNRGDHQVRHFTPEEDARLIALEGQGKRISEIARALGRRSNSVKGRLMCLARRDARRESA